jgi:hypothetical protein
LAALTLSEGIRYSLLHMRLSVSLNTLALAAFISITSLQAEDWKVSGSFNYDTGDYGTGTDTTTIYMPLTLTRYLSRGDVSFTVPYIYQESSSLVTTIAGKPNKIRQQTATTTTTTTSNDGIGDLILKGHYYLLEESRKHPLDLSLMGKIKFPTADDSKGLGTGEFDETFGVEVSKRLNDKWTLFSDLAYTFIGNPPGTSLDNQIMWDIGAGYQFLPELNGTIFYEYRNALTDSGTDPHEIYTNLEYKITKTVKVFGGLLFGLSDGSPDIGFSLGSSVRF